MLCCSVQEDTWVFCKTQSGLSLIPRGSRKGFAVIPLGMPSPVILQQALFANGLQANGGSRDRGMMCQDERGLQVTVWDVRKDRKKMSEEISVCTRQDIVKFGLGKFCHCSKSFAVKSNRFEMLIQWLITQKNGFV